MTEILAIFVLILETKFNVVRPSQFQHLDSQSAYIDQDAYRDKIRRSPQSGYIISDNFQMRLRKPSAEYELPKIAAGGGRRQGRPEGRGEV